MCPVRTAGVASEANRQTGRVPHRYPQLLSPSCAPTALQQRPCFPEVNHSINPYARGSSTTLRYEDRPTAFGRLSYRLRRPGANVPDPSPSPAPYDYSTVCVEDLPDRCVRTTTCCIIFFSAHVTAAQRPRKSQNVEKSKSRNRRGYHHSFDGFRQPLLFRRFDVSTWCVVLSPPSFLTAVFLAQCAPGRS